MIISKFIINYLGFNMIKMIKINIYKCKLIWQLMLHARLPAAMEQSVRMPCGTHGTRWASIICAKCHEMGQFYLT